MEYEEWKPCYEKILTEFGYNREEDERSASVLDRSLKGDRVDPSVLRALLSGKQVSVAGNASSISADISSRTGVLITADEATTVAIEAGFVPEVIVTDLDGRVEDQVEANAKGAIAVIHAHGDNVPAVKRWSPRFTARVVATTQSRPFGRVYNFGGFTDGDRAVALAHHFGAARIRLLGFDFDHPNPKDEDVATKRRKLQWARRIVADLGVLSE